MPDQLTLGELRHTSAGNVYRLEEYDGKNRVGVRRVAIIGSEHSTLDLWDHDVLYHWSFCQWDHLPRVGEKSHDPSFGIFGKV